ncbi:unnamed protein product [Mucor fragilis]
MLPNIGIFKFPELQPGIIGYLCLAASSVDVLVSALMMTIFRPMLSVFYCYFLYGVYNSLIYISLLVQLHVISRQQKRESKPRKYLRIGNCFIYLGYLWSIIVLAAGIAAIILGKKSEEYINPSLDMERSENDFKFFQMAQQATLFIYYSIWGFIGINLILTTIFYNTFKIPSKRCALILFNIFTIIVMITSTAVAYSLPDLGDGLYDYAKKVGFVSIFLIDLPNALAIVTWFFAYGGKLNRQQSVASLCSETNTDNTSSIANAPPTHKHSV